MSAAVGGGKGAQDVLPVSVVIPCWRCEETIGRAMASVAAQTAVPAEVILVDDGGGRAAADRLGALAASYPPGWVRVVSLAENGGPGRARNAGWEAASGAYVAFLDADDAWFPEKLARQIGWMAAHPEVALTGHHSVLSRPGAAPPEVPETIPAQRVGLGAMLRSNRFPTRSVVVRREVPFRFPPRSYSEDFALWLDIVAAGLPCYVLDAVLACSFRPDFSPGGLSGRLWRHELGELAVLRRLRAKKALAFPVWALASAWSLLKFVRRVLIVLLRRKKSNADAPS